MALTTVVHLEKGHFASISIHLAECRRQCMCVRYLHRASDWICLQELRDSGAKDPILLSKDLLDRIVVERMRICTAPSPSRNQPWPLFYLMGAWARASDMRNRIQEPHKEIVVEALRFAREMLTNYAALLLIGIFEQVRTGIQGAWGVLLGGRVI